jgi:hypothetical protein
MNSQYLNQQPQKTLIMPTLESVSQKMKMYVSMADTASLISDESLKRLEIKELFDEIGSQMPPVMLVLVVFASVNSHTKQKTKYVTLNFWRRLAR